MRANTNIKTGKSINREHEWIHMKKQQQSLSNFYFGLKNKLIKPTLEAVDEKRPISVKRVQTGKTQNRCTTTKFYYPFTKSTTLISPSFPKDFEVNYNIFLKNQVQQMFDMRKQLSQFKVLTSKSVRFSKMINKNLASSTKKIKQPKVLITNNTNQQCINIENFQGPDLKLYSTTIGPFDNLENVIPPIKVKHIRNFTESKTGKDNQLERNGDYFAIHQNKTEAKSKQKIVKLKQTVIF